MSFCPITSISAVGPKSRGCFIPPPPKVAIVPWRDLSGMFEAVGFLPGEWELGTNKVGTIQGLPHLSEVVVIAKSASRRLVLLGDSKTTMIVNCSNFIPVAGEFDEFDAPKAAKRTSRKVKSAAAVKFLED